MRVPPKIDSLLPQKQGGTQSLQTISQASSAVVACRERYKTGKNFLALFNPDKQFDYCADLQRVYTGKAPSLGVLNEAFGRNITETWLAIQIQNLSEFSGVKDKIDAAQIDMLAKVIIATFHFLKVTELMHFFLQFKSGKYGKFYGAVDGMAITEALQEFCRERSYKIFLFEQEREKEEAQRRMEESRKNACTWEEYLRQKGEKQRPSPLARTEKQLKPIRP